MQVAIVTGAARGIGAATARALADAGHGVVLVDRCEDDSRLGYPLATPDDLAAVADECGGHATARTVIGNADDAETLSIAVEVAAELGDLCFAIAAGVIAGEGPAWEVSDEAWQVLDSTNVSATRKLAAITIPVMLARPRPRFGRFIAIGSPIAHKATPRLAAYAASKAAVESYVKSLAADLAATDITANTIIPGSTDTNLLHHSAEVYDLESPGEFVQHHLIDRLVEPAEIGAAITCFVSQPPQRSLAQRSQSTGPFGSLNTSRSRDGNKPFTFGVARVTVSRQNQGV